MDALGLGFRRAVPGMVPESDTPRPVQSRCHPPSVAGSADDHLGVPACPRACVPERPNLTCP